MLATRLSLFLPLFAVLTLTAGVAYSQTSRDQSSEREASSSAERWAANPETPELSPRGQRSQRRGSDHTPVFGGMFDHMMMIERAERDLEWLRNRATESETASERLTEIIAMREQLLEMEKAEFVQQTRAFAERMMERMEHARGNEERSSGNPFMARAEEKLKEILQSGDSYDSIRDIFRSIRRTDDDRPQATRETPGRGPDPEHRAERLRRELTILQQRQASIRDELRGLGIFEGEAAPQTRPTPRPTPQQPPRGLRK